MTLALNYSKKLELNMQKKGVVDIPKMPVRIAVDCSGSMSSLYDSGWVEDMLVVFSGAAMTFDDNKALELGFFNSSVRRTLDITEANPAEGYIQRNRIHADGGTLFVPILEEFAHPQQQKKGFLSKLLGGDRTTNVGKSYLAIITDGDAGDRMEFKRRLSLISKDVFVQIIGIGDDVPTAFLQELDDSYENVDFRYVENPHALTQDQMLDLIANEEFVEFIKD